MSDKKISQLPSASDLNPDGIVPISQIDPMDGILKTFGVTADKFSHGYFTFPNDTMYPVVPGDVGKLAMNDGSGTAKVYALSNPVASVTGEWQIVLDGTTYPGLGSASLFTISVLDGTDYASNQSNWRNGALPMTGADELTYIKASIDALIIANNLHLTTSLPTGSTVLTITETTFTGYQIWMENVAPGTRVVIQRSTPALIEAPTAFPLGKIVGVRGNDVLISSGYIETYTMDPAQTIDSTDFSVQTFYGLDFSDKNTFYHLTKLFAMPAAGGAVTSFDLSRYTLNGAAPYAIRDQLLGLIIGVNGTQVTVMHTNAFGPVINAVFKTIWANNLK